MSFDIASFVLGAFAGILGLASVAFPNVGRLVTRCLAVTMLTVGVGLLTWAIDALIRGDALRPMGASQVVIQQPSEAIGLGAGLLAGAVLALLLSLARR